MKHQDYTCYVFYGFDRSASMEDEGTATASFNRGSVFRKTKAVSLNLFRLAGQINRATFKAGFFTSIDAALPALSVSRESCGAAGKKTALGRSEARSPAKDIQTWVIPGNTRNATTAAILAITVNRRNLIISNERWYN
jgi:hypothetical protein